MVDRTNLPTHIVTDSLSGREIYVYEEDFRECEGDIDEYFRLFDDPMNLTFIRERATVDELLKFANEVRIAGGGEVINELMLSEPQNSEGCLIATALNFSSTVNDDYGTWAMHPEDTSLVSVICDELGLDSVAEGRNYDTGEPIGEGVGVELPKDISFVAMAFDTYRDVELEQYDSLRNNNVSNPLV